MKLIGLVLLVYGILGVAGAVLAYLALRAPAKRLRALLAQLAQQFQHSSLAVKKISEEIFKCNPVLLKVAEFTGHIDKAVREAGKRFGEAAQALQQLEAGLNTVKVPALSIQTRSLDLDFGVTVVKSISLKEYEIKIGPLEYKLYGPPLDVKTANVGLSLGQVTVVNGVTVTEAHPFRPLGDALDFVGDKMENAKQQITLAADHFGEVKARTLELKENLEKSVDGLKDFVAKLKDAGVQVHEMSGLRLLALLPALAAGFFVLIHLAFALTGYALLAQ
ncbi:MAG: hypothetical protein AAB354_13960 [candidate division KSB1 bacterium]